MLLSQPVALHWEAVNASSLFLLCLCAIFVFWLVIFPALAVAGICTDLSSSSAPTNKQRPESDQESHACLIHALSLKLCSGICSSWPYIWEGRNNTRNSKYVTYSSVHNILHIFCSFIFHFFVASHLPGLPDKK